MPVALYVEEDEMTALSQSLLTAQFVFFVFGAVFSLVSLRLEKSWAQILSGAALKAVWAGTIASLFLVGLLAYAFIKNDFSIYAVASHSDVDLPWIYKVSAVWAGAPGSFLLWSTMLCFVVSFWGGGRGKNDESTRRTGLSIASLVCAVFAGILLFVLEPFAATPYTTDTGTGLNPLLQNFWMIIHPPLLFAGYSLFAVPFALLTAAIFTGAIGDRKIFREVRPWVLMGFVLLSAGIATGAKWAYVELGWGGFWAWDPVENASLVPWLATICAIHAIAVTRKTGKYGAFTVAVTGLPFLFCLFATFVTRSGVVQSVHGFGTSVMSTVLLGVIGFFTGLWLASNYRAIGLLKPCGDKNVVSMRARFTLAGNLGLLFLAGVITVATMWPVITRLVTGTASAPERAFYDKITFIVMVFVLIGLILAGSYNWTRTKRAPKLLIVCGIIFAGLALMGIILARIAWPVILFEALCLAAIASTIMMMRDHFKSRHWFTKSGSIISHLGIIVLAAAIGILVWGQAGRELSLKKGQSLNIGHHTITYTEFRHESSGGAMKVGPQIEIRKQGRMDTVWPHKAIYGEDTFTSEIGLSSWAFEDLYFVFKGIDEKSNAIVELQIKPMMNWIWAAMVMVMLGAVISFFARRGHEG